ncbi:hypothetical protein BZM27_25530 [Paraburkholderia steynii]|uniref:Uncharacterized protein n=1 Tax=Paraburkholderia steynii TaxID=1245441 RepID=A0A4V2NGW6_9BURK|nr:hypothetical protein BZM27_25530 [Paraburkholderia steynii]
MAIRSKQRGLTIAFVFYSPKNKKKMTVNGIPAYCHLLLSEGNPLISAFRPLTINEIDSNRVRQAADVFYKNGETETWVFSWGEPKSGAIRFLEKSSNVRWRCAQELEGKNALINNWIRLTAFMSAARGLCTTQERALIRYQMDHHGCATIGSLIDLPGVDCGLMLSEVAAELASGAISCDLESRELKNQQY